jgi:hypothetical protein
VYLLSGTRKAFCIGNAHHQAKIEKVEVNDAPG